MEEELLISQKEEIIKNFLKYNEKDIKSLDSEILDILLSILYNIGSNGYMKYQLSSLNAINELDSKIKDTITESKFYNKSKEIKKVFKDLIDTNIDVHKNMSNIDISNIGFSKLTTLFYEKYKEYFNTASLFNNLITTMKDFLFKNLVGNTKLEDVKNGIKSLYENFDIESEINNFIVDTFYAFDGAIQSLVIDNYKMKYILYYLSPNAPIINKKGKLIESRPQCKKWTNMQKIAIEDLESEIEWAYQNGKGMIPSTTIDNFYINRGGYNCRHLVTPLKK